MNPKGTLMKLTVVIPVYNEVKTLADMVVGITLGGSHCGTEQVICTGNVIGECWR